MKRLVAFAEDNWPSAVAGALGALFVVMLWALAAAAFRASPTLEWIEDHSGLAAWVQAVFSVVAILASCAFSLWVPLHVRDLGERDAVQRAINALTMMTGSTHSAWSSTRKMISRGQWDSGSEALIRDAVERATAMTDLVPASMQLCGAVTIIARCRGNLVVLTEFVSSLARQSNVRPIDNRMAFDEVIGGLETALEMCGQMKPLKVGGAWMIFAPGDAADHPEIDLAVEHGRS
ncbi:hypothetical protein [Caulobacter henricii]|uniref:Uncharacterized protein n=1 Tax=Caulobacter henricii TaxID=69395 RepID=A0A0P0P151_9CAUL|nr:hypothetical protein [Caulobacter henricii]ALL14249.1 hypothetical protein AQ619_13365 [Caulobacter henricii]